MMTEQQTSTSVQDRDPVPRQGRARDSTPGALQPWSGWVLFGAVVMSVVGAFAIIEGVLALAAPTTYVATGGAVLTISLTGWGWLHLVLGVLVLVTGLSLLRLEIPGWARGVAIVLVAVNTVVQMAWLPAYPIWSLIVLALDFVVLYALIVTWDDSRP